MVLLLRALAVPFTGTGKLALTLTQESLYGHWRAPVFPWPGLLKLRSEPEKRGLISEASDKVGPDRQAAGIPVKRHGHCRLAGRIVEGSEGGDFAGQPEAVQRIVWSGIK